MIDPQALEMKCHFYFCDHEKSQDPDPDVMLLKRGCFCVHVMMVASRYFRLFLHIAISGSEVLGLLKDYEKNFRSSSSSLGSRGGPEMDWRYSSGTN